MIQVFDNLLLNAHDESLKIIQIPTLKFPLNSHMARLLKYQT